MRNILIFLEEWRGLAKLVRWINICGLVSRVLLCRAEKVPCMALAQSQSLQKRQTRQS